jgi:hypothetical protein
LTLIATASVYIGTNFSDFKRAVLWKDRITVISLRIPGNVVLLNTGDGDVWIEGFDYKNVLSGEIGNIPVNKVAQRGEVLSLEVPFPDHVGNSKTHNVVFLSNATGTPSQELIGASRLSETACLPFFIMGDKDIGAQMMDKHYHRLGRALITSAANVTIDFVSTRTGSHRSLRLPEAKVLYALRAEDGCQRPAE